MGRLIPFYQYFFTYYKANKRVMVLDLPAGSLCRETGKAGSSSAHF